MAQPPIRQTWAEVLEEGWRVMWPLMDDVQKVAYCKHAHKYLGLVTSDGVRCTWQKFGEAVGSTAKALKTYHARSQGVSGASSTAAPIEVRRAFSDLKKPGVMDAVMADPDLRKGATDSIARTVTRQTKEMSAADGDSHPRDRTESNEAKLLMNWTTAILGIEGVAELVREASPADFTEDTIEALRDGFVRGTVGLATVEMAITTMEVLS